MQFKRKDGSRQFLTQLLKTASLDREKDEVIIEADARLWELYQVDYAILLRRHPYALLKGKEVAQTLYTYIASLPDNPAPIAFSRLRERLLLTSMVKEQNRIIKAAVLQLQEIGYIECSITKKGRESYVLIHKRNKRLDGVS